MPTAFNFVGIDIDIDIDIDGYNHNKRRTDGSAGDHPESAGRVRSYRVGLDVRNVLATVFCGNSGSRAMLICKPLRSRAFDECAPSPPK
ncbi:hypothetical protein [Rhodococcus sp. MEB041]|uniref:hypothetical protein n=1 Tax=Rhodococcus sp. MEB041 TaxID=3040323 RepID=UPI00254A73B3|nr:hypothetical protein [Rhodococcus sp. MEB041]